MSVDIKKYFKNLVALSRLGDPESKKKVSSLLELNKALTGPEAIKLWTEKIAPEISSNLGKLCLLEEDNGCVSLLINSDEPLVIPIEDPDATNTLSLSEHLRRFIGLLNQEPLEPLTASILLREVSQLNYIGCEPNSFKISLNGIKALALDSEKRIRESISADGRWTVPSPNANTLYREFSSLVEDYPKRIEILERRGLYSEMEEELAFFLKGLLSFYQYLETKIPLKKIAELTMEELVGGLVLGPEKEYLFEVKANREGKINMNQLINSCQTNPFLTRLVDLGSRYNGSTEVLEIKGPSGLISEVLNPLHDNFQLRLI